MPETICIGDHPQRVEFTPNRPRNSSGSRPLIRQGYRILEAPKLIWKQFLVVLGKIRNWGAPKSSTRKFAGFRLMRR